ncbi:lipopolysaccharide biosynthesis protein [Asticcacaulis sp. 201]|uniref:GumC family protein n=1 Tax=Asticcacaulis sp. 201 TaxID=3028787 RepID=UPI0029169FF4|nr:lipopolysaccharide biosynthesis protein [Asticcacaulis sp. 201]MDV6332816.1 lipopolysaccharide biosynthesis protein [Asticcacaulis sp. 201]
MHIDDVWDDEDDKVVRLRRPDVARKGQQRAGMAVNTGKMGTGGIMQVGLGDMIALLFRELWLMLIVFGVIFGIGLAAALSMPSSYTAGASLLMQLGKNYVYEPIAGDAARGATATIDQVVQSEVEILNSTELKRRVIARLGYKVILPSSPSLWHPATDGQRADADQASLKVIQGGFQTATSPANNVVRLTFKHENAQSASLILNTLIDEYQVYRQQVYTDATGPLLNKQKEAFDRRLAEADAGYQAFLARNGVGDYETAKTTYAKIYDQVTTDMYAAQTQLATDRAKLAEVNSNLRSMSPEMSIERDLDLSVPNKIFALQQQRQDLLSRYLPGAQPVKDIEAQIASLQALMNSGRGVSESTHKMGVNTVYQGLLTQKMDLEADIASVTGRLNLLQQQAGQVMGKLQALTGLEAQYNTLSTERNALQDNIKIFTQRIQENEAAQQMTKGADDTVRVVEKASMPDKPKSLKRIILILSFLFAGFTALCAGLLRVYTRKGFVNAEMAARTLDLPILAQATRKAA